MTIREAIIKILETKNIPLYPEEIYLGIIANDLYSFNTDNPVHVVTTRLRRDCEGLSFKASSKEKFFRLLSNGKYWLKSKKIPQNSNEKVYSAHSLVNEKIEDDYIKYIQKFKISLLDKLKQLHPNDFEHFCKNFITAYGFEDAKVTQATRDGGIDGYGNLKIGFTHLEVAFECKRWDRNKIYGKEIRSFRGGISQSCIYGIYFTTSTYSNSAKREAEREGYKPIVLLDGDDIVNFMIKNGIGVGLEKEFSLYVNQIDLLISSEDINE